MGDASRKGRMAKKLTKDEVSMIRNLFSEGYSKSSLARAFYVNRNMIHKIVSGENWNADGKESS
jgi:hypothetical protein